MNQVWDMDAPTNRLTYWKVRDIEGNIQWRQTQTEVFIAVDVWTKTGTGWHHFQLIKQAERPNMSGKLISYIYMIVYVYTYMMYKIEHILIITIYIYTLLWLDTFCMNSWDLISSPSDSISCAISGGNGRTSGNFRSGRIWRRTGWNGEPLPGNIWTSGKVCRNRKNNDEVLLEVGKLWEISAEKMFVTSWLAQNFTSLCILRLSHSKSTMQTRTALHILREVFLVVKGPNGKPVYLDDYGHSQIGS